MKLSRSSIERMLKRELAVVLPRMKLPMSKPQNQNGIFKRKKSKRGRNSGGSNKENDNLRNVTRNSQPNLNLIQIEKALEIDQCDKHSIRWQLTENDRKILLATLSNKRETTTYSRFDSLKTERSETCSRKIVSQSQSLNVSQVIRNDAGTSYVINNAEMNKISVNPKPKHHEKKRKKGKCSRKDSGICMESPKKNKSTKRKFSDIMDDVFDNAQKTEEKNNAASMLNSPENGIRDLKAIIESHSSHRCTNEINRKVNNVETWRTPDGVFIRKDFIIRITQCCSNKPSKDVAGECTTSVVASTSRHENIEKSSKQERKNIAVEKKVGINTRTKMNGTEKTCTRIVEVQTTEQRCKKIKLHEPSCMVTRRKAAFGAEYDFVSLPNKNRSVRKNQTDQPNRKRKHAGPSASGSLSSLTETKENMSKDIQATMLHSNGNKISKILENIILHREQSAEPRRSQGKQEIKYSTGKESSLASKDDTKKKSENVQKKLQKSTRSRKLLNYKELDDGSIYDENLAEDDSSVKNKSINQKNSKQLKTTCGAENQQLKLELPVKPKNKKSAKSVKNNKIEAPKKSSDFPVKRLMKKTEALEKTEKYNEQKKNLRNAGEMRSSKTVALKSLELPRCLSKTQNNDSVAGTSRGIVTGYSSKSQNNDSVANTSKTTPCVTFSSKTPKTIPQTENGNGNKFQSNFTPCILLDKLDATNISSYAITPLREDRDPLPSKSCEDYGIDDVDTDDSTDEEDNPKKVVPQWARSLGHRPIVQFYFPRDTIRDWIRPPTTRFTVKSLFF